MTRNELLTRVAVISTMLRTTFVKLVAIDGSESLSIAWDVTLWFLRLIEDIPRERSDG